MVKLGLENLLFLGGFLLPAGERYCPSVATLRAGFRALIEQQIQLQYPDLTLFLIIGFAKVAIIFIDVKYKLIFILYLRFST